MSVQTMRAVDLPSAEKIPALGMGTWHLGAARRAPEVEIETLRTGLDLGMTLVDTADMYGDGASETLVGQAIAGRRDDVFLVSKVLPQHAAFDGTIAACDASLRRLGTDRLDLYLLHWRGRVPLEETIAAFDELKRAGTSGTGASATSTNAGAMKVVLREADSSSSTPPSPRRRVRCRSRSSSSSARAVRLRAGASR